MKSDEQFSGIEFQEDDGKTVKEKANNLDIIRIEQAKNMLETTSLKIYEISKLVGYSNTDYFYLKFKKHTNMTPKEFKRTQEEKQ